jgi:hypothetical protein
VVRRWDWPERFAAFLEERRFTPFEWGVNDCALFCADGVLVQTGIDLAEGKRTYSNERGAQRQIVRAGGMAGLASRLTPKDPRLAQYGEVVIANCEGRETFGHVLRDGHWCAPGALGLVFRPMSEATQAFGF